MNRVYPRDELDAGVDELVQIGLDKFPECTRYTKTQLNYWKDLSWYGTIGHARDWLTTHFTSLEPYEGMTSFVEKRPARYRELREMAGEGKSVEFLWGPYRHTCAECGAKGIPANFSHCGACGAELTGDE